MMCYAAWHSWARSSTQIPQRAAIQVSAKVGVISEGSAGEGSASKMVIDRILFLGSCWNEGLSSLLAGIQKLPPTPCQMGLSNKPLILSKYASWEAMELIREVHITMSYNLIMKIISFYFIIFYWLGASHKNHPPTLQRRVLHQGIHTRWQGPLGPTWHGCCSASGP